MSNSVTAPNLSNPPDATRPPVADPSVSPPASAPTPRPRRRVRARFWLLLLVTALAALVLSTPPWHAAVRIALTWQAARQGCDVTVDAIEGGPFDTTHLYNLHFHQRGLPPSSTTPPAVGPGTDLRIAHAQFTLAWALPWQQRSAPSWVRQLTLDGLRGQWDLSPASRRPGSGSAGRFARLARFTSLDALIPRLVPADFLLRADDATLRRGRYHLRLHGLSLSGSRDGAGSFLSRVVEVGGPRFDAALPDQHGRTLWDGTRLTLSDLDLGDGVRLARATLDGSHLDRRRLDWDGDLRALGGTVRGQGAVNFSRERLALEFGGSLHQVTLGPLARLLDVTGPADGQIGQASFSFRGDPENWLAAEMWLAGRATDFRWGQRRWESLEVQAVVTNRRVQVHRLELRQSRNRLSLNGECSLPPDAPATSAPAAPGHWWQAGFACNVDARLEDLRDLAQLFGPPVPDLAGRMSVNGRLSASPGTRGYDGYLNVEGSRLSIRGAPLEFLRSTLLFRGEELNVADLQATQGGDYLTGHGSLRLAGAPDFQALGRVSIDNLAVYAPAFAGLLPWASDPAAAPVRSLTAGVRLEGSVLHLDQCQGEQDGNAFQLVGGVDLRDPSNPLLDLALTGEQPPRAADPADADAPWRAGIAYTLDLRGPLTGGATIHGDVQLLHGRFDGLPGLPMARLAADSAFDDLNLITPAPPPPGAANLLAPLLRRLPEAWRDWPLDLHVTAATPLPSRGDGRAGQVTPDLTVTGTGRNPLLGGKLAFRSTAGPSQENGVWYFSPGQPEAPVVSAAYTMEDGLRGTFVCGPYGQPQTVTWDLGALDRNLTLQPAETPPLMQEMGPLAAWAFPLLIAPSSFPPLP